MKHSPTILIVLALLFLQSACTVSRSPITGNKRVYGFTWEEERQLGAQADQQIVTQMGIYEDPELQSYVDQVAQQVLAESHLRRPDTPAEYRNTPFTFRVLDSDVVNAFALPGGYVYVTRGLLTHLGNEAELAVVLGHEIGHVAARHAAQRAAEQQLGQLGVIGGAILGGVVFGGAAAENILNLGGVATQLLLLQYSREDEEESDALGVEYAALAGYQAGEAADFFNSLDRLQGEQGDALPTWQSTHPDPGEREARVQQMANEWQQRVQMSTLGREQYLNVLEGTVLGENPRQGFVENGVFYHPELRFQFPIPSGFEVVNQYTQVVLIGPNQQAIQYVQIANTQSAQAAASAFVQQGVDVIESGPTRINGLQAYGVIGAAQLQSGQQVGVVAYFIEHNGRVYSFTGLTPYDLLGSYQGAFVQAPQGFRTLTDSRILNIDPVRVNVITTDRSAPFRAYLPANLPRGMTAEELAILNQVTLDEVIPQGTPLKLPSR